MSSKMLIDASHPEETRVVVLKGQRVEEFDFESASKRQLRGNIYLAKVTRVEPSLQAAFVDYGGNRHGFLAFSEIHPDYYQIPHADRQALLEEEARAHRDEEDEARGNGHRRSRRHKRDGSVSAMERRGPQDARVSEPAPGAESVDETQAPAWSEGPAAFDGETDEAAEAARDFASEEPRAPQTDEGGDLAPAAQAPAEQASEAPQHGGQAELFAHTHPATSEPIAAPEEDGTASDTPEQVPAEASSHAEAAASVPHAADAPATSDAANAMIEGGADSLFGQPAVADSEHGADADDHAHDEVEEEVVEQIGGDEFEETVRRSPRARRHYKIQEVIKRRQILLVQVVKEERGNKGAALTTYLSLAGRYSVLMPNTARGGGISRKITDAEDRKRLKAIAQDLEVPEGMGIILRTAGAARSKIEVNRDFEYLLRMWESVRELTLKSTAPSLVYEEGSLIKRSIRDLYTRDVEDVIVAGEHGYREARDFMRMLMPSAAKNVQLYKDSQPIFAKTGAEAQLDAMFSNHVTLKSGGYLVINQTEALVAIDVNSGRSTREHNIEDTALRTNLEAADEIARQLRLRDLAGLIVVDFIDMEEGRNNRAVERRIKDALKNDRARIQIGRISHFGLLEMSRQRIRTGVLEGSTVVCPHCAGSGTVRSTASIALHVLRLLEDALIKDASHDLTVRTRTEVALYMLNQKRSTLNDLEARFGVSLSVAVDVTLTGMVYHAIERGELATPALPVAPRTDLVRVDSVGPLYDDAADELVGDEDAEDGEDRDDSGEGDAAAGERDRSAGDGNGEGRRRKRRRRRRGREREPFGEVSADAPQPSDEALDTMAQIEGDYPLQAGSLAQTAVESDMAFEAGGQTEDIAADSDTPVEPSEVAEPPRKRRSRRNAQRPEEAAPRTELAGSDGIDPDAASADEAGATEDTAPAPKRRRPSRARAAAAAIPDKDAAAPLLDAPTTDLGSLPEAAGQVADGEAALATESAPDHAAPSRAEPEQDLTASASETVASPAPAPVASPAAEPDPDRPKRSGWWQRAKATFGS